MARKALMNRAKARPKYRSRALSRCERCGRSRAVFRRFRLCRLCFRELAHRGEIPGVTKASW